MREKSITLRCDINLYFSLQTHESVKFQDKVEGPQTSRIICLVSFEGAFRGGLFPIAVDRSSAVTLIQTQLCVSAAPFSDDSLGLNTERALIRRVNSAIFQFRRALFRSGGLWHW